MKKEIALFNHINDLHLYLDDKLIFFRNSNSYQNLHFIFDNRHQKIKTEKFLRENDFIIGQINKCRFKVLLSNSVEEVETNHFIFINTNYNMNQISNILQSIYSNNIGYRHKKRFVYFLNADSFFGYYYNNVNSSDVTISGSPFGPIDMEYSSKKPF
jgi:hypothetical protein